MRNTLFSVLALSSFFAFAASGCTVESTSPPSSPSPSGGGTETPSTSSPTEPSKPSQPTKTPAKDDDKEEETKPKTPPTLFFEATLDGEPAVFDSTGIELDDGTYKLVGTVNATSPYGSDKTLTVRFEKGETGAGICESGKRSVDLWYKDEADGVIRGIGTGYIYGSCSMTLDTSIPGYVSGKAQGTLGGAKQKTFSVSFAQKLP